MIRNAKGQFVKGQPSANRGISPKLIKIKCLHCNDVFEGYADRKYCSYKCSVKDRKAKVQDKYCEVCGKKLGWSARYQPKRGIKRCLPCSKLSDKWLEGTSKTRFEKGLIPWNKNKIGVMSTPWNKGTKGVVKAWNKGKPDYKHRGSNHHNWKGGRGTERHMLMHNIEYKLWRTAVFIKDNYTCVNCGIKNGLGRTIRLEADHIKPWVLYPELRYTIDNGRTLCRECHMKTDTWGRPSASGVLSQTAGQS